MNLKMNRFNIKLDFEGRCLFLRVCLRIGYPKISENTMDYKDKFPTIAMRGGVCWGVALAAAVTCIGPALLQCALAFEAAPWIPWVDTTKICVPWVWGNWMELVVFFPLLWPHALKLYMIQFTGKIGYLQVVLHLFDPSTSGPMICGIPMY